MNLGREAMGAKNVKTYAMPKMAEFLKTNGPWNQLVNLGNVSLVSIFADSVVRLNERISVVPFLVPHRDEFSETVGFKIIGPSNSALFIPDIDKWAKWNRNILDEIKAEDIAFVDGTFFQNGEIPGRDMSEIPHPFIEESMTLFQNLDNEDRRKIHFIHFNHTNPVLISNSAAHKNVVDAGFHIAKQKQIISL
jgi:pyrroloquinoline quinone biosynthesis protein B